jgi:hypothetical protein
VITTSASGTAAKQKQNQWQGDEQDQFLARQLFLSAAFAFAFTFAFTIYFFVAFNDFSLGDIRVRHART